MELLINIFVLFVAFLHLYFFVLEAYFWSKPLGRKIFKLEPEFAKRSSMLALNQGVYNIFLSAGLIWSVLADNPLTSLQLKLFFLICVSIAGIAGGLTVNKRIFIVQALPALVALILIVLHHTLG